MLRRGLVAQRPAGVEVLSQFSQFADACPGQAFHLGIFPCRLRLLPKHELHDWAAIRAAKSNSCNKTFPALLEGFARRSTARCFSISFKVARMFWPEIHA